MTTKNKPPLNEMPGEIAVWNGASSGKLYAELPGMVTDAITTRYIRHDLVNKAPEPLTDEKKKAALDDLYAAMQDGNPIVVGRATSRHYSTICAALQSPPETGEDEE